MKYENLLEPIQIGALTLKNRLIMPAMHSNSAGKDHKFTQVSADYYGQRAYGGFALIIPEFLAVDKTGYAAETEPSIEDDTYLDSLKLVVDAIHAGGGKCAAQLHHAGVETETSCVGMKPWSVSGLPSLKYKQPSHRLETEEIEYLIDKFIEAANRAKRAGFDMVEVHAAHGYLIEQFLSPFYNKRQDQYGGSYANRARFACEIIKGIKNTCGADYPVQVRISAEEYIPNGMHIEDVVIYAQLFEEAGADSISISAGTPGGGMIVPTHYHRPGYNVENAAKVKAAVSVPVICVGRINDPDQASLILKDEKADIVALGRESVADYEFPNKIAQGRPEEIYRCTGCMQRCYYGKGMDENDKGMSCMINPFSGKMNQWVITKTQTPKKVAIVGGGVSGLEAAWILGEKGHAVTVFEKDSSLGGQYRLAAVSNEKQDYAKTVDTLHNIGLNRGVQYVLNHEVTKEELKGNYDVVIVASGAAPIKPNIKGMDSAEVIQANEILSGAKVVNSTNVLILGGGIVGCECAEFLNNYQCVCTIVDMIKDFAPGMNKHVRKEMFEELVKHHTQMIAETKVVEIFKDGIIGEKADGEKMELRGFDQVVLAFGSKPYHPLGEEIADLAQEVYVIGDAVSVRDAQAAIFEAAKLALKI